MSDKYRTIAIADILPVMDPALLSAVCEAPIDGALQRAVTGSPRISTRMAMRIAADLEIPATIEARDSAAIDTLVFGSHDDLDHLLLCSAGLAAGDAIRRTVERDAVSALYDIFGAELYTMILTYDASHATAPVPSDNSDARVAGLSCLADWLIKAPAPLTALINLRFDYADKTTLNSTPLKVGKQFINAAADLLATPDDPDA